MKTKTIALLMFAAAVLASGPTVENKPLDGITVADSCHGPTMPPFPWDGIA